MNSSFSQHITAQLSAVRAAGTYKRERVIATPQGTMIRVADGQPVLNLCANNYLGLAQHPAVAAAAKAALDQWGYGCASVRFICGTQGVHKQLEQKLSEFLGTEDTILYSSCFDANGGLFETLLGPEDAIISDELNHASIIDGVRLCKAQRLRYLNNNMADLEAKLQEADAKKARFKMVDDSHAIGFMGQTGRGTPEHCGVMGRVDILTGTLGKALGGASGGYTSGRQEIIELLRQRSRPYLFSNTLAPSITGATLRVLELLTESTALRDTLETNTTFFREGMAKLGFTILPGTHPICPVMLGDAALATRFADAMLVQGVYVIGFSFPVVPKDKARIRTQISAAHSRADLEFAIEAFGTVKRGLGL
jgi:glycine C-acetyltransferase